jgi:transcription elongation GreA/GreB family factor
MGPVKKSALVQKIIAQLDAELEGYARSARAAHAEATDEQSKAENKYDTRGLEASYLAHGQSRQAAETSEALEQFAALPLRDFGAGDLIELGALVELETKSGTGSYFLGPRAGGMEIKQGKHAVLVITPHSPLGQQLVGKKQGDRWETKIAGQHHACRVVSVA